MTRQEILQIEHELSMIFEEAVDKMNRIIFPAAMTTRKDMILDGLKTCNIEFHIDIDVGELDEVKLQ